MEKNVAYDAVQCSSQSTAEGMYELVDVGATKKPGKHETMTSVQKKSKVEKKKLCVATAIVTTIAVLALGLALVAVIFTVTSNNEIQALKSQLNASIHEMKTSVEQSNIESRELREIVSEISSGRLPLGTFLNPAPSCKALPEGNSTGNYWIRNAGTGSASLKYCDMTRSCCNSTGGWMRVAHLDMTNPSHHCPSGFRRIDSPKRTCGRPGTGCYSTTYPLDGILYSHVCGRIKAYQYGSPDAFDSYYNNRAITVDSNYVDGVSLTHGRNPREHIRTFANALDETRSNGNVCPCTKTDTQFTGIVPPFIENDYFCDTGSRHEWQAQFYSADPLWDGAGCGGTSTCCQFNNPPWFCKQLPQPTTDDIELRLCADQPYSNEDITIEQVELYVQ